MPYAIPVAMMHACLEERQKIAESRGHWRKLQPGQKGHDRQGNRISGLTWVSAGSAATGVGGLSVLGGMRKETTRKTEKPKKVRIYFTDPGRGSGHWAQGNALGAALERRGVPVEYKNFDDAFTDPEDMQKFLGAFRSHYRNPNPLTLSKRIAGWFNVYYGPRFKGDLLKKDMTEKGVLNVFANTGLGWAAKRHGGGNAVLLHTDQSPHAGTDADLAGGRTLRHLAPESALGDLMKETPNLQGRVVSSPDLPIMPRTTGPMVDGLSGKSIKMDGKYNITISGGGLGLDTHSALEAIAGSKFPDGTVIHVVTGAIEYTPGTRMPTPEASLAQHVIDEHYKHLDGVEVRVHGWAPLQQMMAEADLNILRPHGTSITEATAAGKPFILSIPDVARSMDIANAETVAGWGDASAKSMTGQQIARTDSSMKDAVNNIIADPDKYRKAVEKRAPAAAGAADEIAAALMEFNSWKIFPNNSRVRGLAAVTAIAVALTGAGWAATRPDVKKAVKKEVELKTKDRKASGATKIGLGVASGGLLALGAGLALRGKKLRALEGLVPQVSVTTPKRFTELLEPGDVILQQSQRRHKPKPFTPDAVTDYIFRSNQTEILHTAIYLGDGKVAHITPNTKTAAIRTIDKMTERGAELLAIRPNATEASRNLAAEIAKDSIGKYRYAHGMSIPTALGSSMPKRIKDYLYQIKDGKVLCSTMVADIYQKAGIQTRNTPAAMLAVDFRALDNPPVARFIGTRDRIYIPKTQGLGFVLSGGMLAIPAVKLPRKEKKASVSPRQVEAFWAELESIGRE